ncbi:MAG: hypothetical protein AAGU05_01225 [Anaerolineaceae bacterium]
MLLSGVIISHPKELSTAAWIVLAAVVIFVVILNFSLFSALKKRDSSNSRVLHRFMNSIRQPEHTDEKMRQELKERVERLSQKDTSPPEKE